MIGFGLLGVSTSAGRAAIRVALKPLGWGARLFGRVWKWSQRWMDSHLGSFGSAISGGMQQVENFAIRNTVKASVWAHEKIVPYTGLKSTPMTLARLVGRLLVWSSVIAMVGMIPLGILSPIAVNATGSIMGIGVITDIVRGTAGVWHCGMALFTKRDADGKFTSFSKAMQSDVRVVKHPSRTYEDGTPANVIRLVHPSDAPAAAPAEQAPAEEAAQAAAEAVAEAAQAVVTEESPTAAASTKSDNGRPKASGSRQQNARKGGHGKPSNQPQVQHQGRMDTDDPVAQALGDPQSPHVPRAVRRAKTPPPAPPVMPGSEPTAG